MTLTPEQIREAIEVAEGWTLFEDGKHFFCEPPSWCFAVRLDEMSKQQIAALASQLKRHAYAMEPDLSITETTRYTHLSGPQGHILTIEGAEPDENSILACTELLKARK